MAQKTPRNNKKSPAPPAPQAAPPARKRILLVDDHPMMRTGLAQIIDKQPDMVTCGEAGTAAEALEKVPGLSPDLILSDITMPGRSGVEFIKDIRSARPDLPILIVSMHDETVYAERVLRAGARGYIMKEAGGENLLIAMRQILKGQVYVSAAISARILDNLSAPRPRGSSSPIEKLSDREFEIFQLIGEGKGNAEIAKQLHLSSKTLDVHRSHIKEKLALKDATALIHAAIRWVEAQNNQSGSRS